MELRLKGFVVCARALAVVVVLPDVLVAEEVDEVEDVVVLVDPLPVPVLEVTAVELLVWPTMVVPAGGQGEKFTQFVLLDEAEPDEAVPAVL